MELPQLSDGYKSQELLMCTDVPGSTLHITPHNMVVVMNPAPSHGYMQQKQLQNKKINEENKNNVMSCAVGHVPGEPMGFPDLSHWFGQSSQESSCFMAKNSMVSWFTGFPIKKASNETRRAMVPRGSTSTG